MQILLQRWRAPVGWSTKPYSLEAEHSFKSSSRPEAAKQRAEAANQRASMDRLLLTLSNDGRVAYATQPDAFHVGPVGGGAAARVEAEDINDLAWCGDLLLVCTKDGLVRIRRGDAWAYTLKVSDEAGAACVAPGATLRSTVSVVPTTAVTLTYSIVAAAPASAVISRMSPTTNVTMAATFSVVSVAAAVRAVAT